MGTPDTELAVSADLGASPGPGLKLRLVVIDGRDDRRQLMTHILEQAGDVVVVGYADGPVSAVDAVDRLQADAVLLEIQPQVTQGLDTISALRDDSPALAIVVCSFHANPATKQTALDRGADAYLVKPVSLRDLRAVLRLVPRRSESHQSA
jgi:DNA-binding response OmpR family regulator